MNRSENAERKVQRATEKRKHAEAEWQAAIKAAADAGLLQREIAQAAEVTQPRIAQILKALAVALLLAVVLPSVASARTRLVLPDGSAPPIEQHWVDEFQVPTPNIMITLRRDEPCPGEGTKMACSIPGTIWLSGCDDAALCRRALAYEVAHQISYRMPSWLRWKFEGTLHMPYTPWGTGAAYTGDGGTGEADWADAYSQCAYPDHRLSHGIEMTRFLRVKLCGRLFPLAAALAS